jgi:hypothetical protein
MAEIVTHDLLNIVDEPYGIFFGIPSLPVHRNKKEEFKIPIKININHKNNENKNN